MPTPSFVNPAASTTSLSDANSAHTSSHRLRALDALLDRSCSELEQLYRGARAPRLRDVEGDLRGRMLAWPSLDARPTVGRTLRVLAASPRFPWGGKSFHPNGEVKGEGINRVLSDRWRVFRFQTFIGRSKAGDFDALQLDYDLSSNPPVIRSIKDEIRELEPGLWLGQAYLQARGRSILWLYFALVRPAP